MSEGGEGEISKPRGGERGGGVLPSAAEPPVCGLCPTDSDVCILRLRHARSQAVTQSP